jgi:urease accessory protein
MSDLTPFPALQRSQGEAFVRLALCNDAVALRDLRQRGSAKVILPHAGPVPEVVFLNTSGGLTGGDRLSYAVALGDGCRAVATTQTAERAYRAGTGTARVQVTLAVGAGGWLNWLPQETILFDESALDRRTRIDLGSGAGCIALESVVLGRAAMGETVRRLAFRDRREIWQDGRPRSVEPVVIDTGALASGFAGLNGARAIASLVMLAPGAADALAAVRAALSVDGVMAAASAFDGKLSVRMMAGDGWPLRRQIVAVLTALGQTPLPRVWQM